VTARENLEVEGRVCAAWELCVTEHSGMHPGRGSCTFAMGQLLKVVDEGVLGLLCTFPFRFDLSAEVWRRVTATLSTAWPTTPSIVMQHVFFDQAMLTSASPSIPSILNRAVVFIWGAASYTFPKGQLYVSGAWRSGLQA
jgi:hypothetical protein